MSGNGEGRPIVLFGATGYTGRRTAAALAEAGERPTLVGRREDAVRELAAELGGLDWAVADSDDGAALAGLLSPESVLVSLVGPFARRGAAAAEAAVAAGCAYIDATGEAEFVRAVFEDYGPRAAAAGGAMVTACGYDFVLGNLAGALALERAPEATRVAVGYFHTSGLGATSSGTRASLVDAILRPHFSFRDGGIVAERGGARVRSFTADGARRPALSMGGTEHYALPRRYPRLTEVDVHLGWFGWMTRPMNVTGPLLGLPGVAPAMRALLGSVVRGSRGGPSPGRLTRARTVVVGVATEAAGEPLAEVTLEGVNGYDFSARILAWAAARTARHGLAGRGALGPIDAFGLDEVRDGCAEAAV